MNGEDKKKIKIYASVLLAATIVVYLILRFLNENDYINSGTAKGLSCIIYAIPLVFSLFLAGIWGDNLELRRMARRFKISWKMLGLAVGTGVLAVIFGFLIAQKYTSLTVSEFGLAIWRTFQTSWYTLLVGAIAIEGGFRGFLQSRFERTYSVLGSSMMTGVIYSIWRTILVFLSDNPSLSCLLLLAAQFIEMSIVLGYLVKLSRKNLYPVIGFHFVWNLVAHTMNFQSRIEFLVYSDLFLAMLGIAMTAIAWMKKQEKRRAVKSGKNN